MWVFGFWGLGLGNREKRAEERERERAVDNVGLFRGPKPATIVGPTMISEPLYAWHLAFGILVSYLIKAHANPNTNLTVYVRRSSSLPKTIRQTVIIKSILTMSSIQIGIGGAACCLPFDPSLWRDSNGNDYKIIHWENKPFVKDGTYCW